MTLDILILRYFVSIPPFQVQYLIAHIGTSFECIFSLIFLGWPTWCPPSRKMERFLFGKHSNDILSTCPSFLTWAFSFSKNSVMGGINAKFVSINGASHSVLLVQNVTSVISLQNLISQPAPQTSLVNHSVLVCISKGGTIHWLKCR